MSANGISTLATKELRQIAKLELAQAKRLAQGDNRPYYDLTQLPTVYDDNTVVDNANVGGLIIGRPWVATDPTPTPFTFAEVVDTGGATITEANVGPLTIEARATSYQVDPHVDGYIKVNGTTIKTTTDGSRGHTLAVISPAGATVGGITTYDTFETVPGSNDGGAPARAALLSALNAVAAGNYIVLVSWDACSFDDALRTALNTSYGTTLATTWASTRYSHTVIAQKVEPISLRSFLSGSGQTAYDAASSGAWFAVSSTDWDAAVAGVTGATKKLVTDGQITESPGAVFSSGYIVTQAQAAATIDAGNFIFALKGNTSVTNQTWRIWGGTTYKSSSYAIIGSATPTTGASGTGTFYYLRKAPTTLVSTTYIGIVGSQNLTMTSTAFAGSAYIVTPYTGTWSNWGTGTQPKVQVVTTTSAVA